MLRSETQSVSSSPFSVLVQLCLVDLSIVTVAKVMGVVRLGTSHVKLSPVVSVLSSLHVQRAVYDVCSRGCNIQLIQAQISIGMKKVEERLDVNNQMVHSPHNFLPQLIKYSLNLYLIEGCEFCKWVDHLASNSILQLYMIFQHQEGTKKARAQQAAWL